MSKKWQSLLYKALAILLAIAVGWIARYLGVDPKTIEIIQTVEVEKPDDFTKLGVKNYTQSMGWVPDPDTIKTNLDATKTLQFSATPAGKAVLGDDSALLWTAVRKVNNKPAPWYPNINQGSVGCCVGAGFKHSVDVCQAMQIADGRSASWKPVAVEVIYGGSRVEVGGGRISGDGSVGAWAAKWVKDFGVVPMEVVGGVDLSTYSPARAREFGRKGVPDTVESEAKQHPVKQTALVTTWADVKKAIQQGYPVAVCSNQGFRMDRDSTGRCRPQGTWAHCMAIIGYRSGTVEGGFILNSWGDDAHTGPTWPADAPVAGFWADSSVIERMVKQGDSFALSDMAGFPARDLNWFIRAEPRQRDGIAIRKRFDPLAFREVDFALAP